MPGTPGEPVSGACTEAGQISNSARRSRSPDRGTAGVGCPLARARSSDRCRGARPTSACGSRTRRRPRESACRRRRDGHPPGLLDAAVNQQRGADLGEVRRPARESARLACVTEGCRSERVRPGHRRAVILEDRPPCRHEMVLRPPGLTQQRYEPQLVPEGAAPADSVFLNVGRAATSVARSGAPATRRTCD